jgi:MFS transporter, ACS family, tartrate transporter
MDAMQLATVRKVAWRLMPFLILCYFFNVLDRVNLGFAGLTMNKELGLSATAFGTGASMFFVSYVLLEVPSNMALYRFGARRWIARIMISWGIVAGAQAFIWNDTSFYVARFLLGAAEAGFFPGMVFYLSTWFPNAFRSRVIAWLMTVSPATSVIGAPLSGWLLDSTQGTHGLSGWQWMFIIQAIPSVILGVITLFYLTDRPQEARWLDASEQEWLIGRMMRERNRRESHDIRTFLQAARHPKVLMLAAIEFGLVMANWGLSYWMPQIVRDFGHLTNTQIGFVSAIPFVGAIFAMVWWGRHSDRTLERKYHLAIATFVAACGIAVGALVSDPVLKITALSIGIMGEWSALAVFWSVPTAFLGGAAGAASLAFINSLAQFGGIVAPWVMGYARDITNSFTAGLLTIAGFCFLSVVLTLLLRHDRSLEAVDSDPTGGLSGMQPAH